MITIPGIQDIARAQGATRDEVISWFLQYFAEQGATWNYLTGTRSIKEAYRGFHNLDQLIAACKREKIEAARKSNETIIKLAAPIAFGRKTQVFDLSRRRFPFGRNLNSGYRIPFFFVENGVIKLYFVQPRKGCSLTFDQLSMVATIHKRFLLDTEFFGQKADVEYIDLCADPLTDQRELHRYSLESLELWPEKRLADRLTLIAEALDYIRSSGIIKPRERRRIRTPDMPLFD